MTDGSSRRPLLRGQIHLAMAVLSVPALGLLLLLADSPREYVSAAIYGAAMLLLYSASAAHHLAVRSRLLRRIDRAMIFVLIGGTYTPFCLLLLGNGWGISLLSLVWGLAGLAALVRLVSLSLPRWPNLVLYVGLGWIGAVGIVPLASAVPAWTLTLVVAGGLLYTGGGLVHAIRRPDPFPSVLGYHEVFHVMTVFAGLAFYLAIAGHIAG